MGWLLDAFSGGLAQRALVEVVVLGCVCGPLGVWVQLYRESYAAESISHGMLPGLVVAALAGAPLLLGALAGVVVAALAIAAAARIEQIGPDLAVAVAVTALFGLGGVLALSPDVPPRLGELLFGDLLAVTRGDVAITAALALGLALALAAAHRRLALAAFDRPSAAALGVRPARVEAALLVLLALTTVAAVQALGNLLAVALVLAPAAAALNLTGRLATALLLSAALGASAGVAGLVASYHLDIAAGAAVALAAVSIFALSALVSPARAGAPARTS